MLSDTFLSLLFLSVLACATAAPVGDLKSKECPPGFTLKGKTCEAIVIVEPQFVCPRGTSNVNGQCVTLAPFKIACPHGFSLSPNKAECTQVNTLPVQYYCTEGEQEGRTCKSYIPKPPVCPAGYTMDAQQCVRFAPILKKCPPGYQKQGKQCARKVSFPAAPACPPGTELDPSGHKCFRFEQRSPYCPAGYQSTADGECLKYVSKVPAPCPHGHQVVGNHCEAVEQVPVDVLCPSDMMLDALTEICVKEIPVPSKCPAGYSRSHSSYGECEKLHPSRSVCPPDTVPSSPGMCKRKIVTQKYPQCPEGFELIGDKCKKVEEYPTRLVCNTGRLHGDQCVTVGSISPQYACPEGFELTKSGSGPSCSRIAQYDCSTTTMKKECEMPEFVQHISSHQRKLKGESYAPKVQPVAVVHHGKQPVCRQVAVQVPKICTKQENAPVKYVCPEAGVLAGKSCQVQDYSPASTICTAGDMDASTGRCLKISISPASWHCATGSDAGGMNCVEFENLPADYVCPAGTEPFAESNEGILKCVERKNEISFPNQIVKEKAKLVCPVGTKLAGRSCVRSVRTPREWLCPDGSQPVSSFGQGDLKCAVAVELITPPPVEIAIPPKFVCPDGTPAAQKLCYSLEETVIEEFCPNNMALADGKCVTAVEIVQPPPAVKVVPAQPSCPEDYSLTGSICKSVQVTPVEKLCPAGFEAAHHYGRDGCAMQHELQAVCPPGTTQGPEGCMSRKHAPPQVTIVRTCTKGTPGCH